jgi:hypothetical protein
MTSRRTCPDHCSVKAMGCYALYGKTAAWWRDTGERGDTWERFCADVAALPAGQLWRHNTAGDLPGDDDAIDADLLGQLVRANEGRRGFTFTHKPVGGWEFDVPYHNATAVAACNREGFVVNLSADTLEEADALSDLMHVGPVVVLLPSDAPARLRTPKGRHVVVCPAETTEGVTCASCRLCANPARKAIVGFRAHGQAKQLVSQVARGTLELPRRHLPIATA